MTKCNNALGFLLCWKYLQIRNVVLKFDLEVLIHYTSSSVEIVYYVVIHQFQLRFINFPGYKQPWI